MTENRIEAELIHAQQARQAENEGRARVCARRAAGWAVREWYRRRLGAKWQGDAVKQLKRLRADEAAPAEIRAAAARLTTQVNHDHRLPFDDDPIEDARLIIAHVAP